ncbi:MAG: type III pantothenate kinase [Proteobacteria bacterium]|nr:type III pantothenate kinase [Pseudomonadota bacterium]
MILLVDIGNTRVKWATQVDGRLSPQRAAGYAQWSAVDWQRELFDGPPVERVLAATVAGGDSRRALEVAARQAGTPHVDFVASTAVLAGVRNAYPDPGLLGVDRWVALIGAFHRAHGACCVVDVGTAATLDAVDASGQHLGGFIVPGPRLMVRSLHAGTSNLAAFTAASPAGGTHLFADNTRDAIERGCRVALAALVDRTCEELARRTHSAPRVYLHRWGGGRMLPYVLATYERVPDLVLRGLARIVDASLER